MHYDIDARESDVIDLGCVTEETKGNSIGSGDTVGQLQFHAIGLEDD